jgi:hypothetical protein
VGSVFELTKMSNGLDLYEEKVFLILFPEAGEIFDYSHSLRMVRRHKVKNIFKLSRLGYFFFF